MNKTTSERNDFTHYMKDVESLVKRKNKEEQVTKEYSQLNPESFDKGSKTFAQDIQRFKQSSETMMTQLESYEKRKRELMLKNREYNPEFERLAASKRKVPQEFLDKIENHLIHKQTNLDRLAEQIEEERDEKCPFVPAISNNSRALCDKMKLKPVQERYDDEIKAKKQRIEQLKTQIEKQKEEKEEQDIGPRKDTTGKKYHDVYKQSVAWYNKKTQKIVEEQVKKLETALQEKEHKPQVNNRSMKAMEGTTFQERQHSFTKRVENHRKELDKKAHNYSHSPNINKNSVKIAEMAKKKKLIKDMVTKIEHNERRQTKDSDLAEEMIFKKTEGDFKPRSVSRQSAQDRLYKTPGKKKIIAKLPQQSVNPTLLVAQRDRSVKDLGMLKTSNSRESLASTDRNRDRRVHNRTPESRSKHSPAFGDHIKFVDDNGDVPVVDTLMEKGRITRVS